MAPDLAFDGGVLTAMAGSVALFLFSFMVGALAKFRGVAIYYVLFGGGFGLGALASSLQGAMALAVGPRRFTYQVSDFSSEFMTWNAGLSTVYFIGMALAIVGANGLIRGHGARPRLLWLWASFTGCALHTWFVLGGYVDWGEVPFRAALPGYGRAVLVQILPILMAFGAAALAFAYARDQNVTQVVLGIAFAAYPLFSRANELTHDLRVGVYNPLRLIGPLSFFVIVAAWGYVAWRHHLKLARNVVVFAVATTLLGILLGLTVGEGILDAGGIARGFDVLVIAYAILRHQYLNLDVKVRWGVSKTTVAAAFVAVFFVVSELAATVFSDRWGTGIGIVAAGALVFAIAPMMRWSERFAERAVPAPLDKEGILRNSMRLAIKDGTIDAEEEVALAEQADQLGVSAARLVQLRHELER